MENLARSKLPQLTIVAYCTAVVSVAVIVAFSHSQICATDPLYSDVARFILELMAEVNCFLLIAGAVMDAGSETCRNSILFRVCAVSTLGLIVWSVFASLSYC